jgi:hypothetical protein
MLLISIHPFAFRRLALIILAVAGFSALCFADPVLMAHRYTQSPSPRLFVPPKPTADFLSASVWSSSASFEAADTSHLTLSTLRIRPCEGRIDVMDGLRDEGFLLMAAD